MRHMASTAIAFMLWALACDPVDDAPTPGASLPRFELTLPDGTVLAGVHAFMESVDDVFGLHLVYASPERRILVDLTRAGAESPRLGSYRFVPDPTEQLLTKESPELVGSIEGIGNAPLRARSGELEVTVRDERGLAGRFRLVAATDGGYGEDVAELTGVFVCAWPESD